MTDQKPESAMEAAWFEWVANGPDYSGLPTAGPLSEVGAPIFEAGWRAACEREKRKGRARQAKKVEAEEPAMTSAVKERGILFKGPLVRAILEGRKTQTRRVVNPQPWAEKGHWLIRPRAGRPPIGSRREGPRSLIQNFMRCPYGVPGDRLWVRETFNWSSDEHLLPGEHHRKCPERAGWTADNVVWRADGERKHPELGRARWRPSIHMPRWASRITLEVTAVRVERLQEISEADAIAEGVERSGTGLWCGAPHRAHGAPTQHNTAAEAFPSGWDSINAARGFGWDANPWVWVIEFERCGDD